MTPIQLLTLGHTVRVCYDLTNYAELSINLNGDLTIHKLVGGSPKIIDKRITDKEIVSLEVDSLGHLLNTPPTDRPLKIGDVLVCHDEGIILHITKGGEYPIRKLDDDIFDLNIGFEDDLEEIDWVSSDKDSTDYWANNFTLKP